MPGTSPSPTAATTTNAKIKSKSKSKEETIRSKYSKKVLPRQKSTDENLYEKKSSDRKELKTLKSPTTKTATSKIQEPSQTNAFQLPVNGGKTLESLENGKTKKVSKMTAVATTTAATKKSKEYSGSYRKYRELQKRNNEREDQLLRRLTALFDDDCKIPELKQSVALEHQLIKRLDYGLNDHMNLFKGNLTKSIEYLSIIQQYRRMQAHKMAILLDRIDEECKKTNLLLEEHFQDINCVYQLMKPDATPKELMLYVCRHFARTFQSFCRWTTKKQK